MSSRIMPSIPPWPGALEINKTSETDGLSHPASFRPQVFSSTNPLLSHPKCLNNMSGLLPEPRMHLSLVLLVVKPIHLSSSSDLGK